MNNSRVTQTAGSQPPGSQFADHALIEQASEPYVGSWNRLVSTTNWEKGRIIYQWREAMVARGTPAAEYADDAWSRRVGGVTAQHVGRLRRVYERFGQVCDQYERLYWSHFQAALDWSDAEMWLEGAVQMGWSVSQMRQMRWETLASALGPRPGDEDHLVNPLDEDVEPALDGAANVQAIAGVYQEVQGQRNLEEDNIGGEDDSQPAARSAGRTSTTDDTPAYAGGRPDQTVELVRPFENLGELPDDLAEAFEAFKLAILRHKTEAWRQISCEDLLAALDALKLLALTPSAENTAP